MCTSLPSVLQQSCSEKAPKLECACVPESVCSACTLSACTLFDNPKAASLGPTRADATELTHRSIIS